MTATRTNFAHGRLAGTALTALLTLMVATDPAHGYIRQSYSLGRILSESPYVCVLRVTAVDRTKNVITYQKVRDLKGLLPDTVLVHNIGKNGEFSAEGTAKPGTFISEAARDWRDIMEWASIGKEAVMFSSPSQAEICLGNYWYQAWREGSGWRMIHSEPTFALSFAGRVQNLAAAVQAMQAGQEVVVSCMALSDVKTLIGRTARLQRLKASLKLTDYNPQRDFVSSGGDTEELQRLTGMPGFSQYGALPHAGTGRIGLTPACFKGDDKPGLCLFGEQSVVLLENREGFLSICASDIKEGARTAEWADYNGDALPDLLLATPTGLQLLENLGGGKFTNRTAALPVSPYPYVTAAAWIRGDPKARPDILAADGFRGLRLYRNPGGTSPAGTSTTNATTLFTDVSDTVGLGRNGVASQLKGDCLTIADVDGDGRDDVLFSAGSGVLLLQTPNGFMEAPASGIVYRTGGVIPAFGDFNGDGRPDLFAPQADGPSRLFANEGAGRFRDVTVAAGDLAKPLGEATCAIWNDFCKRGRLDLLVGCVRGQNRYLRNNGNGTFTDASGEIGLDKAIYNTTGICALDANQDGVPDLLMGNSGAESGVLLGSQQRLLAGETTSAKPSAKTAQPENGKTSPPANRSPASPDTKPKRDSSLQSNP